ncbi:methyltransferase family protein [Gelidibacter mesophilus]|uniref:methyltransferase family protein n=1 Tax=Gelidibacter mesophilus TaxID=169050 RepID=UPI000485B1F6|nr:isoprenylcysteine carboxylmethyltransferase family protein [Gelidibacter mesophilus]
MNLNKPFKDYLFVGIQILLFVAYVLPVSMSSTKFPEWLRYSGFVLLGISSVLGSIALLQLNTKLSPFPSPVFSGKLIQQGAFRISRHPIYTALIFSGLGYAIYGSSVYKIVITALLFLLFHYKSIYEEKLLIQKFPAYKDYKTRTRRFI